MTQPARLTSGLLARKGRALPTEGPANGDVPWSEPLPPWSRTAPCGPDRAAPLGTARPAGDAGEPPRASGGRIALTLRLDPERHTRLKILAARRHRSSQAVLLEALDRLLEVTGSDCACLRPGEPDCPRNLRWTPE